MTANKVSRASLFQLYVAWAASNIGDRIWLLGSIFICERLGGMRLVCVSQFLGSAATMLSGSHVGSWLDRVDRRRGALTAVAVNNVAILITAAGLYMCLRETRVGDDWLYVGCIAIALLADSVARCAMRAEELSVARDWIVVISQAESGSTLARRNAELSIIEHASTIFAPIIGGFALSALPYHQGCLAMAALNCVFWALEHTLLSRVYASISALHTRSSASERRGRTPTGAASTTMSVQQQQRLLNVPRTSIRKSFDEHRDDMRQLYAAVRRPHALRRLGAMLDTYKRQDVLPAALGLAMLYASVLTFDGLAIAYGKSQHLSEQALGNFRAVSSALAVIGTSLYAAFERWLGVRQTGVVGLASQQLSLWICLVSILLPGSPFAPLEYSRETTLKTWWDRLSGSFLTASENSAVPVIVGDPNSTTLISTSIDWSTLRTADGKHQLHSILFFFLGLTLTRVGVWMADLAITQLMQMRVPEKERGTVFGVQSALSQSLSMLKDLAAFAFPDPKTFGLLMIISVLCVVIGVLLYIYYLIKTRRAARAEREDAKRRSRKVLHDVTPTAPLEEVVEESSTKDNNE